MSGSERLQRFVHLVGCGSGTGFIRAFSICHRRAAYEIKSTSAAAIAKA